MASALRMMINSFHATKNQGRAKPPEPWMTRQLGRSGSTELAEVLALPGAS